MGTDFQNQIIWNFLNSDVGVKRVRRPSKQAAAEEKIEVTQKMFCLCSGEY